MFVFVISLTVLLFLLMPFLSILEFMLIALGVLGIVWGVIEIDDQIHLNKVKQQHREICLRRLGRQVPPRRGWY